VKAILVDDEPLARERLNSLLRHAEEAPEVIAETGSSREAVELINNLKPEVVFLDIQMPVLDGFDVVSMLQEPLPYIIFVTAYDEYAIKAFEVYALDYLTKPVRMERLQQTLDRLIELKKLREEQNKAFKKVMEEQQHKALHMLSGRKGRNIHILNMDEVISVQSADNLIYAHTADGRFRIDLSLDEIEIRTPDGSFIRTHRSALVNVKHIRELIPWFSGTYEVKMSNKETVKVSRRRVKEVKAALGIL
jgi:two-component system LytT family response regulator